MKKFLTILPLLFILICTAQVGGIRSIKTLNQRFGSGAAYLLPTGAPNETGVLESTYLKVGDSIFFYYTSHYDTSAVSLITTDSIGGTQNKRGKVIFTRSSGLSDIVKVGSTFYMFAVDWNGAVIGYLYTSSNGYTWSDQGVIFAQNLIPNITGYGNLNILKDTSGSPVQIAGKYRAYVEANEASLWQLYLLESTSLTSSWTFVQKLSTLQVGSGSYSGACTIYLDGVYYMFYHYSPTGVLPTYLGYATSTDGLTWTQKEVAFKGLEAIPYGVFVPPQTGTSQIADVNVIQVRGKTYMSAEYGHNSPSLFQLWKWVYSGTFKELITGLNNCIGCPAVQP